MSTPSPLEKLDKTLTEWRQREAERRKAGSREQLGGWDDEDLATRLQEQQTKLETANKAFEAAVRAKDRHAYFMARVALGQCKDAYAQLAGRKEPNMSLKLQQLELDIENMESQSPLVTLSSATSGNNSTTATPRDEEMYSRMDESVRSLIRNKLDDEASADETSVSKKANAMMRARRSTDDEFNDRKSSGFAGTDLREHLQRLEDLEAALHLERLRILECISSDRVSPSKSSPPVSSGPPRTPPSAIPKDRAQGGGSPQAVILHRFSPSPTLSSMDRAPLQQKDFRIVAKDVERSFEELRAALPRYSLRGSGVGEDASSGGGNGFRSEGEKSSRTGLDPLKKGVDEMLEREREIFGEKDDDATCEDLTDSSHFLSKSEWGDSSMMSWRVEARRATPLGDDADENLVSLSDSPQEAAIKRMRQEAHRIRRLTSPPPELTERSDNTFTSPSSMLPYPPPSSSSSPLPHFRRPPSSASVETSRFPMLVYDEIKGYTFTCEDETSRGEEGIRREAATSIGADDWKQQVVAEVEMPSAYAREFHRYLSTRRDSRRRDGGGGERNGGGRLGIGARGR